MPITGKICPDVDKLKEMKASGLQVAVTCDNTALLWIVGAVLAQFLGNRPLPWPRTCVSPLGCQSLLIVNPSPSAPPSLGPSWCSGRCPVPGLGMSPVSHGSPTGVPRESHMVPSSLAIILQYSLMSLTEATGAVSMKIPVMAAGM